ncbi:hypothetical protein F53441_3240 [Fusarium austroafricanum]|uniref:3-beta hydroxysteroid dehydrogenase/isomerase domain-containing protein n=1 Tax=Fusarium austroafricanum TaxID=2364996 RepID=A0A8H4KMX1_9HYPO|nr:hypothetical protein F53441_3240 [Fusarium austroafricanum]
MSGGTLVLLISAGLSTLLAALFFYLRRINGLLKQTPDEVGQLLGKRWTPELLSETYEKLENFPVDYKDSLPPKLERRYIITGGNGLVGGYIVLQLLARGTPPKCIRVVDIRETERDDMRKGLATEPDYVQADITSKTSVDNAFGKPWDKSNVLAASRAAGADIFSSTSSGSICLRPVEAFVAPWAEPRHYWQVMDTQDFDEPLRPHEGYFNNYAVSKAVAERLVCAENEPLFRTGCIRPANGVYGHPMDNPIGTLLSREVNNTWVPHVVQNFVHGANVAVAHLNHEAVLAKGECPQAGKPFVVTDPGPPITFGDIYTAVGVLSVHSFRNVLVPPLVILLMSYVVEWRILLPYRFPVLKALLSEVKGDLKALQPGLFTICTHLVASDAGAQKSVHGGGLGYKGVLTTLDGVVSEIMEWNQAHAGEQTEGKKRVYTSSLRLAETLEELGSSPPL